MHVYYTTVIGENLMCIFSYVCNLCMSCSQVFQFWKIWHMFIWFPLFCAIWFYFCMIIHICCCFSYQAECVYISAHLAGKTPLAALFYEPLFAYICPLYALFNEICVINNHMGLSGRIQFFYSWTTVKAYFFSNITQIRGFYK